MAEKIPRYLWREGDSTVTVPKQGTYLLSERASKCVPVGFSLEANVASRGSWVLGEQVPTA